MSSVVTGASIGSKLRRMRAAFSGGELGADIVGTGEAGAEAGLDDL